MPRFLEFTSSQNRFQIYPSGHIMTLSLCIFCVDNCMKLTFPSNMQHGVWIWARCILSSMCTYWTETKTVSHSSKTSPNAFHHSAHLGPQSFNSYGFRIVKIGPGTTKVFPIQDVLSSVSKIKLIISIISYSIYGTVSSAYPILLWWSSECVRHLIIIIKSEVWTIV